MRVNVERCRGGGNRYHFRLEFQINGSHYRENIRCEDGENWNRSYAIEAKDLISANYGVKRENIRFDH